MRRTNRRRMLHGVTLIELIVTLAIGVILLTLGVSGMTALVKRNARSSEVNALVANLNYARTEAVLRGADVAVCPIDPDNLPVAGKDPCTAIKAKDDTDRQWQQGYIVYVADGFEHLRIQPPSRGVTIETVSNVSRLTFHSDGSSNNATLRVCDAGDNANSDADRSSSVAPPRAVVVSNVGRVRVAELMPDSGGSASRDIPCAGDPP